MKKALLASALLASIMSFGSQASEVTTNVDDGVLKYSYNFVYLKCESASCNGAITRWHPIKVYYKFIADIPPHSEVRLYWNKNVPAGIAAGKRVAHTIGAECPDGSNMTAKWFLDSAFKPVSALATDCDGVEHTYSVHEFHF
ncbi:hypothetical protein N474_23585 [Pseudoalteromonas luteoviolacea CPMOR-2]|uniref:Chitin-binding type-4 domain-containing protein n=1 Tax=Pseudoalteromonas luteoviolacea DSM 6061 TaxID=1365250 RepID=A0A166WA27_9GAMM|nr:hypothetical protein [Pseudoalteromonas luteoviolacea]KZN36655.1 hypothetical protein N475_17165 [Pseudoalteromonas luteoviolacea DSM 6061]KZN51835.1 hypothetical protein N474_23585 [Pseudoalteromonas luteoviolacea CPMOR-2]MBE0390094.1 hypothetical protein [Pseudoalteromonas luteoviolacea DSM 6061]